MSVVRFFCHSYWLIDTLISINPICIVHFFKLPYWNNCCIHQLLRNGLRTLHCDPCIPVHLAQVPAADRAQVLEPMEEGGERLWHGSGRGSRESYLPICFKSCWWRGTSSFSSRPSWHQKGWLKRANEAVNDQMCPAPTCMWTLRKTFMKFQYVSPCAK